MKIGNGLFGKIYAGNTRVNKNGLETWTKKEDVTDMCIASVYQWFIDQSKKHEGRAYEVKYDGLGTLTYKPEEVKQ